MGKQAVGYGTTCLTAESQLASGILRPVGTTGCPPSVMYHLEPMHHKSTDWLGLEPALQHSRKPSCTGAILR